MKRSQPSASSSSSSSSCIESNNGNNPPPHQRVTKKPRTKRTKTDKKPQIVTNVDKSLPPGSARRSSIYRGVTRWANQAIFFHTHSHSERKRIKRQLERWVLLLLYCMHDILADQNHDFLSFSFFLVCIFRHRWTGRFEAHLWDKSTWNSIQNKKGRQSN